MPYAAVIGDPVAHSVSPLLHRAAYAELGLDWEYRAIQVPKGQLAGLMRPFDPNCRGLSVTMPHKQDIAGFLDHVDGLAKATGAINTVVPAASMLAGFNTDVYGIVQAISQVRDADAQRATIIGAGATAASAMAAAVQLGARDITLVARNFSGPHRAPAAANRLGLSPTLVPLRDDARVAQAIADADIIVSTLPGTAGAPLAAAGRPRKGAAVLDVAYGSGESAWCATCDSAGASFVPGLAMLVHQAVLQVQLMTSQTIDASVMFDELRKEGRWN
ncbi:MAG: shikimate dehydrogenase [Actinomycetaceae bacterium]|nr:shikimate dehydrogenase [Actinomycetaceae bacterium]MDU0969477.1 shikimate dehydrogenase [Actinomycetaceae bacterium]